MEYIKKTAESITKHALEVIDLIDQEQVPDDVNHRIIVFYIHCGQWEI